MRTRRVTTRSTTRRLRSSRLIGLSVGHTLDVCFQGDDAEIPWEMQHMMKVSENLRAADTLCPADILPT